MIAGSTLKALYLASHADHVVEWPVPEGRLSLKDLMEHATRPQFVHYHEWTLGDLVIWDNRTTMHRARPFDDIAYKRELTRVTTLDIPRNYIIFYQGSFSPEWVRKLPESSRLTLARTLNISVTASKGSLPICWPQKAFDNLELTVPG